jgi:protocatechuate 3,4-dioxygenase beta subunit
MRNNKLVIALLVLVLVIGTAVGIWMVTQGNDQGRGSQSAGLDDGSTGGLDGGDPLDSDPLRKKDNRAPDETDTGKDPAKDPTETTEKTDSNPKIDPDKIKTGPDEPPVEPVIEYEPHSYEITVHGKVTIKSDGRAAVGAKVTAEVPEENNFYPGMPGNSKPRAKNDRPKGSISGSTTTDGAGEYRMALTVNSFRPKGSQGPQQVFDPIMVVATMSGYAPARSTSLWVLPDTDEEVNLKLAVPAAVRGRVIDAVSHEGIAGATGQFSDVDSWRDGGSQPISFTTDDKGYFNLNPVPSSNYVLSVQAEGYASYDGWRGQGRINLAGGEEKDIGDIPLMLAGKVSGRVVSADGGAPIPNATVELKQSAQWGGWSSNSTTTGEDGTFTIAAVDPGSYTLQARAKGYAMAELTAQAIEPGQDLNIGDIRLGQGLLLSGVVTDAEDKPLKGAKVSLIEPPGANTWFQSGDEVSSDETDEAGRFELAGAYDGTFTLKVTAEGFAAHSESLKVAGANSGLKVRMSTGGTVLGRVMDADGTPVPNIQVRAINHDTQGYSMFKSQPAMAWGFLFAGDAVTAMTGEDGSFRLENVNAGTYLLAAIRDAETPATKDDIKVENDREVNIGDLLFAGKGSARITVTEDGIPVPELGVTLNQGMAWGGSSDNNGTTDNAGTALIEDVPAGTWYIRTARDEETFDTDNARRRIVIESGRVTELTLELRPKDGVHLHGKLTINGKATFQDIILLGMGTRSDVVKTTKPQQGGYYEFIGLKTGSYVLHARESDTYVSCKAVLDLKEEGDFPFDMDFKGFLVTGTVSTPDNTPAQRSSVSLSIGHLASEHPDFATWLKGRTNADSEGKFKFENVPPGTYVISASLDGVGTATTQVTLSSADQGGVNFNIQQNSGSIKLTVTKLNGTPASGGGFAMVSLNAPDGTPVDLGEFQGWFMLSEGATQTIPTVEPGTYTLVIKASGYLQKKLAGVAVKKGEVTSTEVELTAAAELHLTFTNTEVTQAMLNEASIRYFDAGGNEIERESNEFDYWGAPPPEPPKPTLVTKYLGPQVTEVRIKVAGFAELLVPVQFAIGKKIEKEESLVAE